MKKLGLIFIILLVAFLPACSSSDGQAYQKNLALWESKGIQHYRLNLKIGCLCPWSALMPLTVEVKNGEIVSLAASNGGDITPYLDAFRPHATIDNLFDTVFAAISRKIYKFTVEYDGTYGFPATIVLNPSKAVMDDEIGYYVTNFEVLP
jgi:hypothetical protein